MHRLKFKHVGHDTIVLHEREIRKALRPFDFLQNPERREAFMSDLSFLIEKSPFTIFAAVIDKLELRKRYNAPPNPYHLAMEFGLERIERFRRESSDTGTLHVLFEGRGRKEDAGLEKQFRSVCVDNRLGCRLDFEPLFVRKEANHCGTQIADLVARPIGIQVIRPEQSNRAFDVIATKFRRSPEGRIEGWGLKCYP
jgi:hypothetical protein